jgi:hypothetical protein
MNIFPNRAERLLASVEWFANLAGSHDLIITIVEQRRVSAADLLKLPCGKIWEELRYSYGGKRLLGGQGDSRGWVTSHG